MRLAERTRKKRGRFLYDALHSPQSDLAFNPSPQALTDLFDFLKTQRKGLRKRSAREIMCDLVEWLGIPQLASARDRRYVSQLQQFLKDWEPKGDTRSLPEFLEYLDYFEQANGMVCLDEDAPDDAVQLMTVHSAKGLEFPHVFLLRVNSGCFPPWPRRPLFEFPATLMKEELPAGDFHIQEERRLFYVALTRAERKLTITTTTAGERKGKIPTFIEDILMEPKIKRYDVLQIAPKIHPREEVSAAPGNGQPADESLFGTELSGRAFFAHRRLGRNISSAFIRAAHTQRLGHRQSSQVPAVVFVQPLVVAEGRTTRDVEFWRSDAYDHQALDRSVAPRRAAPVRGSGAHL